MCFNDKPLKAEACEIQIYVIHFGVFPIKLSPLDHLDGVELTFYRLNKL